jgi:hypothetical protein
LKSICFVLTACAAKTVHCPVSGQGKRATLIVDGSLLRPCVVVPRKTYDDDWCTHGLTKEKIGVCYQLKGSIRSYEEHGDE